MFDTNLEPKLASPAEMQRRGLMSAAGLGTLAVGAAAAGLTALTPEPAHAQAITDSAIANFALNFEYLGAELYTRAITGQTLAATDTTSGTGTLSGGVVGGRPVTFVTPLVQQLIAQLMRDELGHVRILRSVLGSAAINEPVIDLVNSYATLASMAGLGTGFDPFANENNLLLAAYALEDVCVTALHGSAALISSKQVLAIAGGLLAVESYQASAIRTLLFQRGYGTQTQLISNLRASLSGAADDQGVVLASTANIVPTDANSLAFARTPRQVLNIAYGAQNASAGGFFPNGVNGIIH